MRKAFACIASKGAYCRVPFFRGRQYAFRIPGCRFGQLRHQNC
jgi:hypothetical protein